MTTIRRIVNILLIFCGLSYGGLSYALWHFSL